VTPYLANIPSDKEEKAATPEPEQLMKETRPSPASENVAQIVEDRQVSSSPENTQEEKTTVNRDSSPAAEEPDQSDVGVVAGVDEADMEEDQAVEKEAESEERAHSAVDEVSQQPNKGKQGDEDILDYEEEVVDNKPSLQVNEIGRSNSRVKVFTEGVVVVDEPNVGGGKVEVEKNGNENRTKEGLVRARALSPARQPISKLIHINRLKRPYTVPSLKTLLKTFGNLVEEDFWIDNIKSNCIAKFETEEEARSARDGLHNTIWPDFNDNHLLVEYTTEDRACGFTLLLYLR
jgi:apoptotic chromatin condensation inducer in the nucleus